MKITNPATGAVIADVATDNAAAVRRKYEVARAGQVRWAKGPSRSGSPRSRCSATGSRDAGDARADADARDRQADPPVAQRVNGLLARRLLHRRVGPRAADEKVFDDPAQKLEERITHEPLGVIANISAWNYPYFVGSNVFVPALVAGNAVLYKPSELATLTGLHIAEMLHEAGIPSDVFVPVVGDGATGAALMRQPIDGIFFTGSYATGARSPRRRAGG